MVRIGVSSGVPSNFFGERCSINSIEDRDKENGDLGQWPPTQGFWKQL